MLPEADTEFLQGLGCRYDVTLAGGMICVLLPAWVIPPSLTPHSSDLLLRLQPGYPDVPPDMWWFSPGLARTDGRPIACADVTEHHLGRTWQRWSRHLNAGQWRSGTDCLQSYLALLRHDLQRSAVTAA